MQRQLLVTCRLDSCVAVSAEHIARMRMPYREATQVASLQMYSTAMMGQIDADANASDDRALWTGR
jgi:hypothetical protein